MGDLVRFFDYGPRPYDRKSVKEPDDKPSATVIILPIAKRYGDDDDPEIARPNA